MVRNIISGTLKDIHIQDVRFIHAPQGSLQQAEWAEALAKELEFQDPRNPHIFHRILTEWTTPVDCPQWELPRKKRQRRCSGATEGIGS
jgi:hypothetical protein